MKHAFILACMALVLATWLPWVSPQWWLEKGWHWWNVKRKQQNI